MRWGRGRLVHDSCQAKEVSPWQGELAPLSPANLGAFNAEACMHLHLHPYMMFVHPQHSSFVRV